MADNAVWFGVSGDMKWVPAPLANYTSNMVRWRTSDMLINGGASVRQSTTAHKELSLSWPVQSQESLAPLVSYFQQPGPFYYLDPLNAESNAIPAYWASPGVMDDSPALVTGGVVNPTIVSDSSGVALGYPTQGVNVVATAVTPTGINIPVPPGYSLHVGAHGTGTGIVVNGVNGATIPLTSTTRTNIVVPGPGIFNIGFRVGTTTLIGLIAQVLPQGRVPDKGGFLPGLGHSTLELNGNPTVTSYSVGIPNAQAGIAADFIETGAWSS